MIDIASLLWSADRPGPHHSAIIVAAIFSAVISVGKFGFARQGPRTPAAQGEAAPDGRLVCPLVLGLVGVRSLISHTIGEYTDQRSMQQVMDGDEGVRCQLSG
jgi:hypothetical protein